MKKKPVFIHNQSVIAGKNRETNGSYFYTLASLTLIAYTSRVGEIFPVLGAIRINLLLFTLSLIFFFVAGIYRAIDWKSKEIKYFIFLQLLGYISVPFASWPRNTLAVCNSTLLIHFFSFLLCISIAAKGTRVRDLIKAIVVVCFILLVGLIIRPRYWDGRISTTYSYDPNDLALFFSFAIPLSFSFFLNSKWLGKIITGTIMVAMVVGILRTGSRGGLIALGITAFFLLFSKDLGMKLWIKLLFITIVVSAFFSPMAENVRTRFNDLISGEDYNLQEDVSGGRLAIWKSSINIFIRNPILGVGAGNSQVVLGNDSGVWKETHNSYLQMALEFGIVGVYIFLSILWRIFNNCTYVLQEIRGRDDPSSLVLLSYSSSLRIALMSYMCAAFFLTQALSITVPIMLALSLSLKEKASERIANEEEKGDNET